MKILSILKYLNIMNILRNINILHAVVFMVFVIILQTWGPSLKGNSFKMVDRPITIYFDESRFFGKAVNDFTGTYKIDGSNIKFSIPMLATMPTDVGEENLKVDEEMMKAELEFLQNLPLIRKFILKNDVLILIREDGFDITFEKVN